VCARSWRASSIVGLVLAVFLTACGVRTSGDLLRKAPVVQSKGAERVDRAHDGEAAVEGGQWDTTATTRFLDSDSFVVFDLGEVHPVQAIWIQADNDDDYVVETSLDGEHFDVAWRSGPGSGAGMRERFKGDLQKQARFLRLSARGGDGHYSVSELQVFEATPPQFPPSVPRVSGAPTVRNARSAVLSFAVALIFFVVVAVKRLPPWLIVALAFVPLYAGFELFRALPLYWPIDTQTVSLLRGAISLVAIVAIAREAFGPERLAVDPRAVVATLGVCGVTAIACFYDLGVPQFWDAAEGRPTFVHILDTRQYYSTAKYFRELGYRHIYEADIAEYLEDTPGATLQSIANKPMRDLDTHRMETVGTLQARIETAKARFTPERWDSYKRDGRALRSLMGTGPWLDYLVDYGGNATPVWVAIAHGLFSLGPPTERLLLATALLDPLLLLAMFVAIGRTFGARTAFVCMVIFGANDFIMYGSNWAGATLRHDWMAYLGLGACALRQRRWMLGGALFAAAATIRAFPGVALVGVLIPAGSWLVDYLRAHRALPTLAELRREQGHVLRIMAGAAIGIGVLVAFSFVVLPPAAWLDWARKVSQLSSDVHATHVGLRSVIGGWGGDQRDTLIERIPLLVLSVLVLVSLIIFASRKRGPSQAAMIALLLVPVAMYPANYYLHMLFLLPIAATVVAPGQAEDEQTRVTRAKAWIVLLLLCVGQYFAVLEPNYGVHFFVESSMLIAVMFVFLWLLATAKTPALDGASRETAQS
jgi:hypothetical protein